MTSDVHKFGTISVEADEVITFAKRFDPQPFPTDPVAGRQSIYGGIIASTWHTASLMMRLFVDHFLSHNASLGSPGVDDCGGSNRFIPAIRCRCASP